MSNPNPTLPTGNAETVRRLFEGVRRRDLGAVLAAYDEAVVIHEAPTLPYGGEYRGHEGAKRHAQGFVATWGPFQTEAERDLEPLILPDGDRIAVMWRHKAAHAASGERIDLPAMSLYRFEGGKIAESRMFHFDTAALLRFLTATRAGTA